MQDDNCGFSRFSGVFPIEEKLRVLHQMHTTEPRAHLHQEELCFPCPESLFERLKMWAPFHGLHPHDLVIEERLNVVNASQN
jgi:hypothetical protein